MGEFTHGVLPDRFAVAGIVSNYFIPVVILSCQMKTAAHNNSDRKRFHAAEGRKLVYTRVVRLLIPPDDTLSLPFAIPPLYPASSVWYVAAGTDPAGLYSEEKKDAWKHRMYSPIQ